jgi:hypothetical protein
MKNSTVVKRNTINKFAVVHCHGTDTAEKVEEAFVVRITDSRVGVYLESVVVTAMVVVVHNCAK